MQLSGKGPRERFEFDEHHRFFLDSFFQNQDRADVGLASYTGGQNLRQISQIFQSVDSDISFDFSGRGVTGSTRGSNGQGFAKADVDHRAAAIMCRNCVSRHFRASHVSTTRRMRRHTYFDSEGFFLPACKTNEAQELGEY